MRDARLERLLFERARRNRRAAALWRYCHQLDFRPDLWQLEVLSAPEKRLAILCGRQQGKSTIVALRAALAATSGPRADVIILAPTARQSKELFRKACDFITHPNSKMPRIISESAMQLEFSTGARILALPSVPSNVRGFSAIKAVLVDEAAFVPDEIFSAVSPMLAVSNGDLVTCSTAWLPEGFFYNAIHTNPDFRRWIKPSNENPRITQAFLESERRAMGDLKFGAEYLCEWLPQGTFAIFDPQLIEESQRDWKPVLDSELFKWDLPKN